jgi:hypothetical protein
VYSRAVAKKDRLVSASAGASVGRFQTPVIKSGGRALFVTADIRHGGELRVGLLDSNGKPLPGHALSDCNAIRASCSNQQIHWRDKSGIIAVPDGDVQIEVELHDADLFSFQFTSGE